MYQIKNILCPTDFSASSVAAIHAIGSLAKAVDGEITLLYVDEYEKTVPCQFLGSEEHVRNHRHKIEDRAREQCATLISTAGLDPARTRIRVRFGTAYQEIISEAEQDLYSVVAFSVLGLGCSSPHLIGRTAERIIRLCRTPVLTLRPGEHGGPLKFESILCPTDFSEYGNYALPYAISIAKEFQAKLILVHAAPISATQPELLLCKFPDPVIYHEGADEIRVERIVGRDIEPENTIVRIAEEEHIDLIIMGTHGARGMRRVQIGNTTEEVIRRVGVPVLSVTHPIHKMIFPRRFTGESQNV
jgi:nucleotide-binding universal stress UspA family protein